jgi:acyl carrier protein
VSGTPGPANPEIEQARREALAAFLARDVVKDRRRELTLDTPLVSSGLVDSLSLISILAFIEDSFGVVIPDEAATSASMDSLRAILELVRTYDRSTRS